MKVEHMIKVRPQGIQRKENKKKYFKSRFREIDCYTRVPVN